jgi:hypothetical protein
MSVYQRISHFHLESIRHAEFVATQNQLRETYVPEPGDKSPGYYRVSLRDEVKTGSPGLGWKPMLR